MKLSSLFRVAMKTEETRKNSSLNVFDNDAVLLFFKFWTFSIVLVFEKNGKC
jgi:hypothetical protein